MATEREISGKDGVSMAICRPKFAHGIKFAILWAVIISVWMMFAVPVVLYHLQETDDVANTSNVSTLQCIDVNSDVLKCNCSQKFSPDEETGLCFPVCGEWEEFTPDKVLVLAFVTSLLYFLHFVGTVIALIFSCYNRKIMFKFPAILLVYYLASPIILDAMYFIRVLGRDHLFCSSVDLLEVMKHPSPYCYVSGALISYIFALYAYWWLFLAIITFWKVWFPVHARNVKLRGHYKYLHLAVIVVSLVLSLIPVISAVSTGGYTISTFSSLQNVCYPRNSAIFFYTFVVPFCIVLPAGSTFNLLTLWRVIMIRKNIPTQAKNIRAETRLLVFFFYFAIATALSLMLLLAGSRNAPQNLRRLYDYFSCEVLGINGDNPCTFDVDRIEEQAFTIASFLAYTLGPYSTLVYVIPVDRVKDKLGTLKSKSTVHSVSYSRRQEEDPDPGPRIKPSDSLMNKITM